MNKQSGFTLIELVVVIIILGILAATAVPKFVDLQSDARVSALQGLKGALESAATLTYSRAAIDGVENDSNPVEQVNGIDVNYGYPEATETALREAAGLSDIDWDFDTATSNGAFITVAGFTSDTCGVTYEQATSSGARPTIYLGTASGATDTSALDC